MITRRKVIVGGSAVAAAIALPLPANEIEIIKPWRARVFWRTVYFDQLQHAVDAMVAFLKVRDGTLAGVGHAPEFGHEERIIVVRGGAQEFKWVGEHHEVIGCVDEGGVLTARVVEYETFYRRGGGREVNLDLIWTSTGRGSA
jgi:hypothetical protein